MTTRHEAIVRLVTALLDGHERSRAFGQPAPWPRDVIVKLDATTFPDAFAPDGREALAALRAAALALAQAGAARVVRGDGWSDGEPRELRLGPGEVEAAYALAAGDGYVPLGRALAELSAHAARLAAGTTAWMAASLEGIAAGLGARDLGVLSMLPERFKRDRRDIGDALTAAAAIASGPGGWERVVSERIFADSKRLAAIRGLVADRLVAADPRWDGWHPGDALDVLAQYGVKRKPGLLRCAGAAALVVNGRTYALEDFDPVAHLPEAWSDALVGGVTAARPRVITTIENETPMIQHVTEAGGPAALGARGELVMYTAGFPAPALVAAIAQLCHNLPDVVVRHWPDADLGGLRIWWTLRHGINHQVELFRVDRPWLDAELTRRPGVPLGPSERIQLAALERDLRQGPHARAPDVRAALELARGLLARGMKLEQERG